MMLKYRRVGTSDLETVSRIEKEAFNREFDKVLSADEVQKNYDDTSAKKGSLSLIYNNNELLGYYCWKEVAGSLAEITDLAILPDHQNKGYGSKVLIDLLEELKDYREIKIVVHPSNMQAIKVYKKRGFKPWKTKENYYNDGEDMLIMVKEEVIL